jgi:hypothetical protein
MIRQTRLVLTSWGKSSFSRTLLQFCVTKCPHADGTDKTHDRHTRGLDRALVELTSISSEHAKIGEQTLAVCTKK